MMKDGGSIAFCSSSIAHRGMANHDVGSHPHDLKHACRWQPSATLLVDACDCGCTAEQALAAAKGAISSMALSAASTYSPHNIRVNVVVPGVIAAKMTTQLVENEQARG